MCLWSYKFSAESDQYNTYFHCQQTQIQEQNQQQHILNRKRLFPSGVCVCSLVDGCMCAGSTQMIINFIYKFEKLWTMNAAASSLFRFGRNAAKDTRTQTDAQTKMEITAN